MSEHTEDCYKWLKNALAIIAHEILYDNKPVSANRLVLLSDGVRCDTCFGSGHYIYPSTAMGGPGIGGRALTKGPCPGTRRAADNTDCPFVLANRNDDDE